MEAKLKDALATKDYYSAHQIYLAIAQRHCRSKRYEEAKLILKDGSCELAVAGERRSSADLARRYVDTLSLGRLPLIDTDAVSVHSILTAIGQDTNDDSLKTLSDNIIKEHPSLLLVVFHSLVKCGALKEAGAYLLRLDEAEEEWKLLGESIADPATIMSLCLAGLKARNFSAVSTILSGCMSKQFPDNPKEAMPDIPDGVQIVTGDLQGDADTLARCLNFCQILFVTFQHRLVATPSVLTKPLQHYAGLLAKLRVREEDIKMIEHSYLLQQQSEAGATGVGQARPDMLANLFQSMMSQQGVRRK